MKSTATARFCLGLLWTCACALAVQDSPAGTNKVDFQVFWPPKAPYETQGSAIKPLLDGSVLVRTEPPSDRGMVAHLRIILSRPSDEAGREFWNTRLAFPEYDWMRYVRVWDKGNQWLWPNLPYMLRLHGTERVERYGGVDPAKGVDNDFAGVVIRKYDATGTREDPVTQRTPLVSAGWHPPGVSIPTDKHTIVHTALSDEFTIRLGTAGTGDRGMAAVWLIYADLMGAKLPHSWPTAPEFAGGILVYFELQWDLGAAPGRQISIRQLLPKRSTGFDWEPWVARTRASRESKSTARLSDD